MTERTGLEKIIINIGGPLIGFGIFFVGCNTFTYTTKLIRLNELENNEGKVEAIRSAESSASEYHHPFSLFMGEYGSRLASKHYLSK